MQSFVTELYAMHRGAHAEDVDADERVLNKYLGKTCSCVVQIIGIGRHQQLQQRMKGAREKATSVHWCTQQTRLGHSLSLLELDRQSLIVSFSF
jgi:hypothetical protein